MKRCENCVWWKSFPRPEWGECTKAATNGSNLVHPDSLAEAVDFEGYQARLYTSIRFGCVQWEKKDAN